MSEQNNGGPAFPAKEFLDGVGEIYDCGMTLRDYFAAKAMQTMVLHRRTEFKTDNEEMSDWDYYFKIIAEESYEIADAMLKARAV